MGLDVCTAQLLLEVCINSYRLRVNKLELELVCIVQRTQKIV